MGLVKTGVGGLVLALAAAALGGVGGCGGGDGSGGGGGSPTGPSTGSSSFPCSPENQIGCDIGLDVKSDCLALVDNSNDDTPTLRIGQLNITKPTKLATGAAALVVSQGVADNLNQCGFTTSGGTFNWLLQFDLKNNKLKTGGAKPVSDPTKGYTFDSGTVAGQNIAPVTVDLTVQNDGSFSSTVGVDVKVMIYLTNPGDVNNSVLLPLNQARLQNGKLSSDNNCIGTYNAKNLTTDNGCKATADVPAFVTGASLVGFITLEQADTVVISSLNETLCALIAGASDTSMPRKCTRTNGAIDFQGDWCSTTDQPADASCADASQLGADFAASAVKVN